MSTGCSNSTKILFVDDVKGLCEVVSDYLALHGYEVVCVKDGIEALKIISKIDEPWLALITDYNMPNLNGGDLIRGTRELGMPFQSVIMTSAMIRSYQDVEKLQLDGPIQLLPKPYRLKALTEKLVKLQQKED